MVDTREYAAEQSVVESEAQKSTLWRRRSITAQVKSLGWGKTRKVKKAGNHRFSK